MGTFSSQILDLSVLNDLLSSHKTQKEVELFHTKTDLQQYLLAQSEKIGFVPTMGALHAGHLSLIKEAKNSNSLVVCSVFVNPTQFNDSKDLERYPRNLEKDVELLKTGHCDVLFAPSVEEIYPKDEKSNLVLLNLRGFDTIMEGQFRPGHFQGVVQVVSKLFEIVKPNNAYFGKKDFQQLEIIRLLAQEKFSKIDIHGCETIREANGLAMSSRNALLSEEEKKKAALFYEVLMESKKLYKKLSPTELNSHVIKRFENKPSIKLDYFELINRKTLTPVSDNHEKPEHITACIAGFVGTTRLIDNMSIN